MRKIILTITITISLLTVSCKKIFEIEPKTVIKEEVTFKTDIGFYRALMGIYILATSDNVYGKNLSYGMIDVMANNYSTYPESTYNNFEKYNYSLISAENRINSVWATSYNMIANCNNILKNLEGKQALFPEGNYEMMLAETKAFRAYLHFDLLRLFAESPATGMDKKAIPYADKLSKTPFEQLTMRQVIEKIITDLNEAQELLKTNDPLITDPTKPEPAFVDFLTDNGFRAGRKFRFNYFAVTGLKARVLLYNDDKVNAFAEAKKIVDSQRYSFGSINNYEWYNDIIAGFHITGTINGTRSATSFSQNAVSEKLFLTEDSKNNLFEVSTYTAVDTRLLKNFGVRAGETEVNLNKFFAIHFINSILKLSEVYLILAETATTTDEQLFYLNKLRNARSLPNLTASNANVSDEIFKEYRKEFLGEGQLFFFYKRKNLDSFTSVNLKPLTGMRAVYKLPIPQDEITFGNINN
jgi:hypothetical protein